MDEQHIYAYGMYPRLLTEEEKREIDEAIEKEHKKMVEEFKKGFMEIVKILNLEECAT